MAPLSCIKRCIQYAAGEFFPRIIHIKQVSNSCIIGIKLISGIVLRSPDINGDNTATPSAH
jgi:hypothetical protein